MAGTEGSLQRLIKTPRTALVRASGQWYHRGLRCCCYQPCGTTERSIFLKSRTPELNLFFFQHLKYDNVQNVINYYCFIASDCWSKKIDFFFRFFYLEQRSLHYRFADKSPFNWKDLIPKNKITICNVLEAIQFSQTCVEADLPPLKKRVSTHNLLCVLT